MISARAATIVWTGNVRHSVKPKLVTAGAHRVARLHPHVLLRLVSSDHRHADDKHRDAEMRQLHSVVTTTLRAQFLKRGELAGSDSNSFPKIHENSGDDPDRQQQTQTNERFPLAKHKRQASRALSTLITKAQRSRVTRSGRLAFFQRAIGPTPIRNIAGAISGTKTRLK